MNRDASGVCRKKSDDVVAYDMRSNCARKDLKAQKRESATNGKFFC